MRIAIPTAQGRLSPHFGHCETFTLVDAKEGGELEITNSSPPSHEPGALPSWLAQNGVDVIIAGGMGTRAQQLFQQNGIKVVIGAPSSDPVAVAKQYLDDALTCGDNICDH